MAYNDIAWTHMYPPCHKTFPYVYIQELGNLPEVRQKEGGIPAATYKFRLYSGKMLELFSNGLFRLDGKLCRGPFTGDDFCIVSEVLVSPLRSGDVNAIAIGLYVGSVTF